MLLLSLLIGNLRVTLLDCQRGDPVMPRSAAGDKWRSCAWRGGSLRERREVVHGYNSVENGWKHQVLLN